MTTTSDRNLQFWGKFCAGISSALLLWIFPFPLDVLRNLVWKAPPKSGDLLPLSSGVIAFVFGPKWTKHVAARVGPCVDPKCPTKKDQLSCHLRQFVNPGPRAMLNWKSLALGGPGLLLLGLFFAPASEIKKSENQKIKKWSLRNDFRDAKTSLRSQKTREF